MKALRLTELLLQIDLETKKVLKALPSAHAALAELKGIASTIPNQSILINTLGTGNFYINEELFNLLTKR